MTDTTHTTANMPQNARIAQQERREELRARSRSLFQEVEARTSVAAQRASATAAATDGRLRAVPTSKPARRKYHSAQRIRTGRM
jgi:hypothetical protein